MSTFFYGNHHQQHQAQNPHPMPQSHNHHGRSRRAPRLSAAHGSQRQYRQPKIVKEIVVAEVPSMTAYRARFEAGRSFDLDDDLEFCPNLLTFDEVGAEFYSSTFSVADSGKRHSVASGSSDRSSLSSGSPDSSPLQSQIQPQITPSLSVSSAATSAYMSPPTYLINNDKNLKIHQPSAIRSRTNAIPIVNPSTGNRIASPPSSISPGLMQQTTNARRW